MMTAAIIVAALTGLAWALAFWDIGRRRIAAEVDANQGLRDFFTRELAEHKVDHKAKLELLMKQCRDEVDLMGKEVERMVRWTYTSAGKLDPEKPTEPWQQEFSDARAKLRQQAKRITT